MNKQRNQRRVKRIQQDVKLGPLLEEFGYAVHGDSLHEQQFPCDLHGGADRKPSARFYPHTNSTFCWACHKSRGPLDYWIEKREVPFLAALEELESRFNIIHLPEADIGEDDVEEELPEEPWEETCRLVDRALLSRTREGDGSMDAILEAWELFDECLYLVHTGHITKEAGLDKLQTMRVTLRSWKGYDLLSSLITTSDVSGL